MSVSSPWSLVVAANDTAVLEGNLLLSAEAKRAREIRVQTGAATAGQAYDTGMSQCSAPVVVFAHQDVYLPPGWADRFEQAIARLNSIDPRWAVAGLYGISADAGRAGYVYSTGLERFVGRPFETPVPVRSLDEMLLVVRQESGVRFDPAVPGFHLYGTDICLRAESAGLSSYVIPCFALHNSRGIAVLPGAFWKAYDYLRAKWQSCLPVRTPCTQITRWGWPMHVQRLSDRLAGRGNARVGSRVEHPDRFYAEKLAPQIEAGKRGAAV